MMKSLLIKLIGIATIIVTTKCDSSPELIEIEPIDHPYKFSQEILTNLETSSEPWKYQVAAWDYSYIGKYEEMLNIWDTEHDNRSTVNQEVVDSFRQKYERKNAKDYIVSQADSFQIIIINEAHHQPLHRVFTTELLKELYGKGYRYLGLETLQESDTEINKRKYPIYSSGTYSIEPQFGNLIRSALDIGYYLFAYESEGNGREREIGQARNIESQIKNDSTTKYLIHCGFDHAVEGEYKSWGKAMAGRLQEFTGINPLTINQTEFTERSVDSLENPLFQNLSLIETSVFIDRMGNSFKLEENPEWFDIMIFHPKTKMVHNRPDWILRNDKMKVNIDVKEIEIGKPFLAMAFKENEDYRKSVPVDIVEVEDNLEPITFALEKGYYHIVFQNQNHEARLKLVNVK